MTALPPFAAGSVDDGGSTDGRASAGENPFDRITRTAARTFDVPIALVSLFEGERQWFKSQIGLDELTGDEEMSFCLRATAQAEPFVVADARSDPRFSADPLVVGDLNAVFFAGHSLLGPTGRPVGALSVIDRRPRDFDAADLVALSDLAAWAQAELNLPDLETAARWGREGHHQLEAVMDTALDAIVTFDELLRIDRVNRSAEERFGRSARELRGQLIPELINPANRPSPPEVIEAILEGRPISAELVFAGPDGNGWPGWATVAHTDMGGKRLSVAVVRDVTERREIERMKDELLAVVGHEIRTPLTSIHGAIGLALGGVCGDLSGEATDLLEIALSNTQRLGRLVDDVLDLARMEGHRVELERDHVEAETLVDAARDATFALAENAGVEVVGEADRALIHVDADRIVQALVNLLSNAIRFSDRGSAVRIDFETDPVSWEGTFRVRDDGRGIPSDKLEHIFDRFAQADASDSRERGGTGLGLAITRQIAELHSGRVEVESTEGVGSTFSLIIPRAGFADGRGGRTQGAGS